MAEVIMVTASLATLAVSLTILREVLTAKAGVDDVRRHTRTLMTHAMEGSRAIGHLEGVVEERANVENQSARSVEISAERVNVTAARVDQSTPPMSPG